MHISQSKMLSKEEISFGIMKNVSTNKAPKTYRLKINTRMSMVFNSFVLFSII